MRLRPGVPVLVRPDGHVQVGLAHPVLVDTDDPRTRSALALMEPPGVPTTDGPGEVTVERLRAAGLLAEARHEPRRDTVEIHGAGPLGVAIGSALAAAAIATRFEDAAPARMEPDAYSPRHLATTCGGAALWTVAERSPWVPPTPGPVCAGVTIASGGVTRAATARWEFDSLPHLLVVTDEAGIEVGPMVVPGRTACAGCVAHHRRERDAAWPALLLQLEARRPWVDPRVVTEAAGAAARLIMVELGRDERTDPIGRRWRFEPLRDPQADVVAPHPDCGCTYV